MSHGGAQMSPRVFKYREMQQLWLSLVSGSSVADQVAQLVLLRLEITGGALADHRLARHSLNYTDSGSFECSYFLRVVRDEPNLFHTQGSQNRSGKIELAMIGLKAKFLIRLDGIESLVLQFIGLQFGNQTDAASLLLLVKKNSSAALGDHLQSQLKLLPAVTPERVKHIPSQALGVNTYQRKLRMNVAHHQRDGRLRPAGFWIALATLKPKYAEVAEFGREVRLRSFGGLKLGWRGAHALIIASDSC